MSLTKYSKHGRSYPTDTQSNGLIPTSHREHPEDMGTEKDKRTLYASLATSLQVSKVCTPVIPALRSVNRGLERWLS